MHLSKRIINTPSSPIRKFAKLEKEALSKGIKVFHFNIGQPDMETPQKIRQTFADFDGKIVLYAPSRGIPECLEAWKKYYQSQGISIETDNIIITLGASEAILFTLMAICDPEDEVLIFEPFYTNFSGFAAMSNVKLVPITKKRENNFAFPSIEEIKAKISEKTKAVLICNPNNPAGTVYDQTDLQALVDLVKEKNLYLISDEVYREFIYNGIAHKSVLSFPEIEDQAVVIDSVSKRFNHCGGRVGCLVSRNKELTEGILKFAQARLAVPTLEQLSVVPLLNTPKEYTDSVRESYKKRRDIIFESLRNIPGVECTLPQGSFYIIARLPVNDAEDFVSWMLTDFEDQKRTVMVTPAKDFYLTPGLGKDEIRIAYVLNEDDTKEAMEVFAKGLNKYLKINT